MNRGSKQTKRDTRAYKKKEDKLVFFNIVTNIPMF